MAEEQPQGGGGAPPEERELIEKICNLRRAGLGYQKIGKLLGVPTSTVFRLAKQHCEESDGGSSSGEQEGQEAASSASGSEAEEPQEGYEPSPNVDRVILESSLEIARKIVLNPKIVVYYDWFKRKYNFDGDLSDFIQQCVEIVVERILGYKLAIVRVGRGEE